MLIWVPGRPWSIQELRERSWDDLHKLWWVCVRERNRIATSTLERQRLKAGYGDHEAGERDRAVSFISACLVSPKIPLLQAIERASCCVLHASRGLVIFPFRHHTNCLRLHGLIVLFPLGPNYPEEH